MNDHASPMSYMDGERSSSPKRKKIRQKYAPKACVSCRRSKLKCTGENPCQRCVDNGKRCFYSEDQTAAEVLQNLSRPTPTPAPQAATSNGNGHGVSHQSLMPPNNPLERRGSDVSNLPPTMEERMTRMERMMEALMQERGLGFTPSGSIEREQSIGFRSETAFSMPILDPIHPALDQMAQPPPEHIDSLLPDAPAIGSDTSAFVRAGNQNVPFPDPARYQQYVAQFFGVVHLRHPCVDEEDFNVRVQRLVTNGATEPSETHFLALCYTIFACCDVVMTKTLAPDSGDKSPGWQWYQLADSVVDKTLLFYGHDDIAMIQYLLFQAVYLTYADNPALAYAAIRTTCTAALQQNFHRQSAWVKYLDAERLHWRICLFWNVYLADRTISMSCDRPASLHKDDINVETPEAFWTRSQLGVLLPDDDRRLAANLYLKYEMLSAELVTKTFHRTHDDHARGEITTILSDTIRCCGIDIPSTVTSLVGMEHMSYSILQTFSVLRRLSAPLIVGRRILTVFDFDFDNTKHSITLASDALKCIQHIHHEAVIPPSCRHQVASILTSMLLIFGPLLLRDDIPSHDRQRLGVGYGDCIERFMAAANILSILAQELPYAKRLYRDFKHLELTVGYIAGKWGSLSHAQRASQDWDSLPEEMQRYVPLSNFPYREVSPPLQGREDWDTIGGKNGVLWLF